MASGRKDPTQRPVRAAHISTEIYLDHVKDRFRAAGFDWRDRSQMEELGLLAAASKSGFELSKLGISEDFFAFGGFELPPKIPSARRLTPARPPPPVGEAKTRPSRKNGSG